MQAGANGSTEDAADSRWMSFSPGYLSVFKIPLLRGRDFRETDTQGAPGVALINEALEKKYWPNGDAVGQQIVVGVGMGVEMNEPPRTTRPSVILISSSSSMSSLAAWPLAAG